MEKARILIVDDEPEITKTFKGFLERTIECEVCESSGGQDAINKINKQNFDLIILDIKMPGLSGIDVIKEIKKEKNCAGILVSTGWDSVQVADEAIKAGAADYITKPARLETLKLKVKGILEKKGKYIEKAAR